MMRSVLSAFTLAFTVSAALSARTTLAFQPSTTALLAGRRHYATKPSSSLSSYLDSLSGGAQPAQQQPQQSYAANDGGNNNMSFVRWRTLSLKAADELASLAVQIAERNAFAPVTVVVMDPTGNTIVSKRMDGCPVAAFPQMAEVKANTCVAMKMSSRTYGDKYLQKDGTPDVYVRVLSQIAAINGRAAAFPGGVLLKERESGEVVGSIGVSGAAGAEDEYCAIQAVKFSSFAGSVVTEPAEHACTTFLS